MAVTQQFGDHREGLHGGLLWRIKVYLQWTGWLQYAPNLMACIVVSLIGWMLSLAGCETVCKWMFFLAGLLFANLVFDIATVKFLLRPCDLRVGKDRRDQNAFDVMMARKSCRSFQARGLTAVHKEELLNVARHFTAQDRMLGKNRIRLEFVEQKLVVWPVTHCQQFFVAVGPKEYDRMSNIDVGRSLQNVVVHATRMGVATCIIGPGADQDSAVRSLGNRFDPHKDHVVCVCAVGYQSAYKPLFIHTVTRIVGSRRLPLQSLFFADAGFEKPLDVTAPPFALFGRTYECCRWSPSSFNAQPTRCVGAESATRFDFYAADKSRWYSPVALGVWLANWEIGCEELGIRGRFAVLLPEERGLCELKSVSAEGPRYDISWVAQS